MRTFLKSKIDDERVRKSPVEETGPNYSGIDAKRGFTREADCACEGNCPRCATREGIQYFLPQVSADIIPPPERIPDEDQDKECECIKSFRMEVDAWDISGPGIFTGNCDIHLPVSFELELGNCCSKEDIVIGQQKTGMVEDKSGKDEFPYWKYDGEIGHPDWWDGEEWWGGRGSWAWFSKTASFKDEPGFHSVDIKNFPVYYGSMSRSGYFKFKTYVKDRKTRATLRELNWGILIDHSNPDVGVHAFFL